MIPHITSAPRAGFTILETVVAFAILAVVMTLVAELSVFGLAERARADARLEAVTAAENVLESARARPWADLTPEWAAGQAFPDRTETDPPNRRLTASVEPVDGRPQLKRVTVTVSWAAGGRVPWSPVALTALFADRPAGDES